MSRTGGITAPVKCEEDLRTPIEIKQEQCEHEENYEEQHAKHLADSSACKSPPSSLCTGETENSYEFLGHMKFEEDESTDLTTAERLSSNTRDIVCPLCQQVYYTKTYYGYHRKREFISHLIKVHDYSHLRGHRLLVQCRGCKIKRERWTFVVGEGNSYKFSDVCSRCQGYTCRPITDASEHQESPEATAETPTDVKEPGVQAEVATNLTTAESLPYKKRGEIVCHLCHQVYSKQARYGHNSKRDFVAHLAKAHNYRHLRGHRGFSRCTSCNMEKRRYSFVAGEGVSTRKRLYDG